MIRTAFRWAGGAALVLGVIFYLAGGDLATSAARTMWYVVGSGTGTLTHTTSSMSQGLDDAAAFNDKADKKKAADDKAAAKAAKP
jgi:hypothetical protein